MPLLSIIITVYNLERYIEECLKSVVNQDFDDYEIVLVDNASTDGSRAICEAYSKKYSQIKFIAIQGESIVGRAHRVGIAEAKGMYLHMLDGDDYVANGCYADIIKILKEKEPDVLMGSFISAPEKGTSNVNDAVILADRINDHNYEAAIKYIAQLPNFHMVHWRYIFKKEIFLLPEETKEKLYSKSIIANYYGDLITSTRILVRANSIYYYDKPFYHYRIRVKGAITSNITASHYTGFFFTVFVLIDLINRLKCDNVRKQFIHSRIINVFKLFSSGIETLKHKELKELVQIFERNIQYVDFLSEIEDNNIKVFCDFINKYGSYEALWLYNAYKKSKLLTEIRGKEDKDIYVFPAGLYGISTIHILKNEEINICGILDNDEHKNGREIMGFNCSLPEILKNFDKEKLENTVVVIATIYDSLIPIIKKQLLSLQLSEKQIIIK
ncbi:MAG: glycosyltransferase family 2 protein [Lutisporaceae bacterium]